MPTPPSYPSVRPLVLELPSEGGVVTDYIPTEVTTTTDAVAAAGLYLDGPTVSVPDKLVLLDRASGTQMRFTDSVAQQTLGNIVGASYNGSQPHSGLPDASHLDGLGPDVGFASGAFFTRTLNGPLVTSETWWTNSNQTQKIYAKAYTYTGPLVTTITRSVYTASGTLLRTITDTLTYSGPMLQQTNRTWN